jgi:hypothetical protein
MDDADNIMVEISKEGERKKKETKRKRNKVK